MTAGGTALERVVVVGAGMVGHRFAEDLVRLDHGGRFRVTLVGAEQYEPYNRILLTEVLAGRASLRGLALSRLPGRVEVHRGVAATRLDRDRREVVLSDSRRLAYDRVVLATGARALVPPLDGMAAEPRHVHVLRDLDDLRAVGARAANARHAVVLGGGALGIEAACGLAARGVAVTVVQLGPQLMAGQLDPAPAAVLLEELTRSGIVVRLGVSVAEVIAAYGELVAVRLTDGGILSTDLLLVSCGIRAESALAEEAGLPVDRGVVVGSDLASPVDPAVSAIGDCAQPPEGMSGLLAPGWDQAERLARALAAGTPVAEAPTGTVPDLRLKAAGVDLTVLGVRPSVARPEDRVITVDDPRGGRHIAIVVRHDRLVGATCLGASATAAELSVLHERGTPLPVDPLALLTPERRTEEASPVRMPGATTVCRCNSVTKSDIVRSWEAGAGTVEQVAAATRATTGCGGCREVVCGLVDWLGATAGTSPEQVPPPDRRTASSPEPGSSAGIGTGSDHAPLVALP